MPSTNATAHAIAQAKSQWTTTPIGSDEKHIANAARSAYAYVKQPDAEKTHETWVRDRCSTLEQLWLCYCIYTHTHTLLHADTFTHRHFYTHTLVHADAFTRRHFYTHMLWHKETYTQQKLLHTDGFTHRRFYTQRLLHTEDFTQQNLLHTDGFTHRRFYTQRLLHTEDFTHRSFYTQMLLHTEDCAHRSFYTDAFYTNAFTHRSFYTQTPLHTETFTHRRFDTRHFDTEHTEAFKQTLLHKRFYTDAFTHRNFHTQHTEALHTQKTLQFYLSFWRSTIISCEKVATGTRQSQFDLSFWWSNLISCERVARDDLNSHFYLSFWRSNLISCERVAPDDLQIALLPQFLAIEPHFVRKSCGGRLANRTFTSVLGDRTSFRAKGLRRTTCISQFYLSFRKGCVSCRLVGTAPAPAFKREIEKKERARGQEGKRARGEDVRWEDVKMRRCEKMWEDVRRCEDVKMRRCEKMWRCEDEKMWEDVKMRRCEDEKMWRWEDVKMRRCDDEKMWRWEDVKMRRCFTDPHYWKNPALRRSREKMKGIKGVIQKHEVIKVEWCWMGSNLTQYDQFIAGRETGSVYRKIPHYVKCKVSLEERTCEGLICYSDCWNVSTNQSTNKLLLMPRNLWPVSKKWKE